VGSKSAYGLSAPVGSLQKQTLTAIAVHAMRYEPRGLEP
jgi:hypothetical protein